MNLTYAQLIKGNRNFRNLLWGQFISELGNWFNFIAGLGLVRLVSDASPTAAGILFVCRVLPFALFSPIAGTFVDRFSRRQVMIFSDLARVGVALMFLLVTSAENLWIAYLAMALLSTFGAFFDGAKNAATPNLTGKEGLLAGTALMFSTRFLLMAIGSALGGWAAAVFGYEVAFLINAASFAFSAFSIWLIPEEATREEILPYSHRDTEENYVKRESFLTELKEGFHYTVKNHFALTILLMNIIWATGGGAINVIFERMGGIVFAERENWNPDLAVALLWTASGFGLFLGMIIAHRVSVYLDRKNSHSSFIVWTLIIHGVLFAAAGFAPTLWLFMFFCFVSRAIVGVEYAVQETMFQQSLPDYIRGRISTLDRGAEMTIFGLSSYFSSELMYYISPQILTVISGILSASAGILWFFRMRSAKTIAYAGEEVLNDA
ncbi:MAG: MFS transporter [Acidobacteria bacterium]|nr:MFS transporter [Acidobacteriota bacterium]MCA1638706.1 MFS transporter [Acidobacteriota bacterium]